MSTRHYVSDADELDDLTYRMLDSRFCKVAMHGQRHEALRHRREHAEAERLESRKARRPRAKQDAEQAR